jgi:hypothetical protein
MPHCRNNSKTKHATLQKQFQNKTCHIAETIPKQNMSHCRNNSKTKHVTLQKQFQNKTCHTAGSIPQSNMKIAE